MKVYLAHSFGPELENIHSSIDTDEKWQRFKSRLATLHIQVVDPANVPIPSTNPQGRFDYCLDEIASSDALIVDARGNLGIGVGAEMMFAKSKGIAILVVCPINSRYRNRKINGDETLHPFIYALSTKIFRDIESCTSDLITNLTRRRNG